MADILKIKKTGRFADLNPEHPHFHVVEKQEYELPCRGLTEHQLKRIIETDHGVIVSSAMQVNNEDPAPAPMKPRGRKPKAKAEEAMASDGQGDPVPAPAPVGDPDPFRSRLENILISLKDSAAVNDRLALIGLEFGLIIEKDLDPTVNIDLLVSRNKELNNA
jgi:hypothetical protein